MTMTYKLRLRRDTSKITRAEHPVRARVVSALSGFTHGTSDTIAVSATSGSTASEMHSSMRVDGYNKNENSVITEIGTLGIWGASGGGGNAR